MEEIRGLKVETIALRNRQRGYEFSRDYDHDELSSLKECVDRIERRLEPMDEK